ncbi:hypothetical protein DFH09DRAFT_1283094 [Mycena vulgaris]|nr:hypothetical protein DFH09DRAFT_1283094 [Mycena vulgaris]
MASTPSHSIYDEKRHEEVVKDPLHVDMGSRAAARPQARYASAPMPRYRIPALFYRREILNPSSWSCTDLSAPPSVRTQPTPTHHARLKAMPESWIWRQNYDLETGDSTSQPAYIHLIRDPRFGNQVVPLAALLGFGTITTGIGFISTRGEFYAMKALLGMTESFVLPGNTRMELSVRIGFFIFSPGYLSGAFGGLVASGFLRLEPIGPVHTWREVLCSHSLAYQPYPGNIFVSEGVITIGVGVILFFLYPTISDSARALTATVIYGTGDIESIVGSWSYVPTDAKTGYHIGNTLNVSLAVVVSAGIAALLLFEYMANRRKCEPSDGDAGSSFRYNFSQAVIELHLYPWQHTWI